MINAIVNKIELQVMNRRFEDFPMTLSSTNCHCICSTSSNKKKHLYSLY